MAAKTHSLWNGVGKNGLNNMDGDGYNAVGPEIPRDFTFFDSHYQIKSHYDAAEATLKGQGFQWIPSLTDTLTIMMLLRRGTPEWQAFWDKFWTIVIHAQDSPQVVNPLAPAEMAQLTAERRMPQGPFKWNSEFRFPECIEQLELPLVMPRHLNTFDSVPYARLVEPFRVTREQPITREQDANLALSTGKVYALEGIHHVKQKKVVHFDKSHLPAQLGNGSLNEVTGVELCERKSKAIGSSYLSKCDQTGYNLIMQKLMLIGGDYCGDDTIHFARAIKGNDLADLVLAPIDMWNPFIGLVNISKVGKEWHSVDLDGAMYKILVARLEGELGWYQQINNLPDDYGTAPFTDLTTGQLGVFPSFAPLPVPNGGGRHPGGPSPGGPGPSDGDV